MNNFSSNLADLKENVDRYLVAGINHIVYHGTCYSPGDEAWPGRLFYAAIHANARNPLWDDLPTLNQYITNVQSYLQMGQPDNDILLYYPMYDRFARPHRELLDHFDGHGPRLDSTAVKETADWLLDEGYSFDFISDRQILNLDNGMNYQAIVVPETTYMPLATIQKLLNLAEAGIPVLFHQTFPKGVPGWNNYEDRQEKYQNLLSKQQVFKKGEDLASLLEEVQIIRESLVDKGLEYCTRKTSEGKYYFVSNWSESDVEAWIPIQANAASILIIDPMTNEKGLAKVEAK